MKKLYMAIIALGMMMSNLAHADIDNAKAQAFVEGVTKDGIENIINANISQSEKTARFEKLFNNA